GVEMAIESLDRALALFGTPIYAFHQIVHNQTLVREFRERGVVFVDDLCDVPFGATVVFSAHGVAPRVRELAEQRGLRVIDATCPLVHKVHAEARRFARNDNDIILIGHHGHDETVGVAGEATDRIRVVATEEEIQRVEVGHPDKVAYLTQTTLSVDETRHLVAALQQRFPAAVGPAKEDICYATQNRQEAVKALAGEADLALVIGSRNSSNSLRLVDVARDSGIPARLIDGSEQLEPSWFENAEVVLLTAGASVPERLVGATIEWLERHFGAVVEERRIAEETLRFQLPIAVRTSDLEAVAAHATLRG
ncbi:MAG TPA: 4-hydroxy-3-methylbut-2-enyl diphosphate reductase, partial [Gemmatimonadales bacterium]|nr:4-hydroxy-3-methylbut-2-enyl diphosphate reductase [Gemmatimonadales bacterium]